MSKNIKFNKNEAESKTENAPHSFGEANFLLQLKQELQIKSKTFYWFFTCLQKQILPQVFLLNCAMTWAHLNKSEPMIKEPVKNIESVTTSFFSHEFKFKDSLFNGCLNLTMLYLDISDIATVTVKGVD